MKKDAVFFLNHIIESIDLILSYTEGMTLDEFQKDRQVQDSVLRRIQIMGEAVKNLPHETTDRFSDIPWSDIARMRDVITHGYFGIDLHLVWNVVQDDIPDLRSRIEAAILSISEVKRYSR